MTVHSLEAQLLITHRRIDGFKRLVINMLDAINEDEMKIKELTKKHKEQVGSAEQ